MMASSIWGKETMQRLLQELEMFIIYLLLFYFSMFFIFPTFLIFILLIIQILLLILESAVAVIQSYVIAILSTLYSSEVN